MSADEPKPQGNRYKNPLIAWGAILGGTAVYDVIRAVNHQDTLSRAAGAVIASHAWASSALAGGLGYLWYHLAIQSKPKDKP